MSSQDQETTLSRRDFLRRGAAAAALSAASAVKLNLDRAEAATARKSTGMLYRTLGRTKLKVSALGMGTIAIENAAVIHRAMDLGINFFDTAECYQGGNSEIKLGKALKGRRDKAIVATKWHTNGHTPAQELLDSLDASLTRLQMDYVDLIQIHGAGGAGQVNSDELWEAFTTARKAGKARFNGVTAHGNQVEVINAAVKSGRYDAVLPSYNAMLAGQLKAVIAAAAKAKVGVIAMKVLQPAHEGSEALKGLRGNPFQQAIQWVINDTNVATAIVDMPNFEQLEEDVAGARMTMTRAELDRFEQAVAMAAAGTCHLCGACTGQCPRGVQVAEVMRYRLYHDGYGDRVRAVQLYRELPTGASAAACGDCDGCRVICPWGVAVRSRMEQMHGVLA